MSKRILVVEDETNLLDIVVFNLEAEGFICKSASNGRFAAEIIRNENFDLILLDVMLPEKNGFEIMQEMVNSGNVTPVIFMTARAQDMDKITGLKSGAVDYITKPFNLEELILRVRIHLRSTDNQMTNHIISIGDFQINTETFEIHKNNVKTGDIGRKEIQLLQLLTQNEGKVVSREIILEKIWGQDSETTTRTIDNYILTLRKLVNDDPKNPVHFHSIRGVGYKFTN